MENAVSVSRPPGIANILANIERPPLCLRDRLLQGQRKLEVTNSPKLHLQATGLGQANLFFL